MKKLIAALLLLTMLAAGLSTVGCTLPFFEEESCAEQKSEDEAPSKASRYTFEFGGKKYNLSRLHSDIKKVSEYGRCGSFIIVECNLNKPYKLYAIINTERQEVEHHFLGLAPTWHSNDILTLAYVFQNHICDYEGIAISPIAVDENEYIEKIEYTDKFNNRVTVTIANETTGETRSENLAARHNRSYLFQIYDPIADNLVPTPGDDTFMRTKAGLVTEVQQEYNDCFSFLNPYRPPLVYYVIHELNLSRLEVEYYYRNYDVTDEFIDALFCEDVDEARARLKNPHAFKIGYTIYPVFEFMNLIEADELTDEMREYIGSDEYNEVIDNLKKYIIEKNVEDQFLIEFVNSGTIAKIEFEDRPQYRYSIFIDTISFIDGTFTEYFEVFDIDMSDGTDSVPSLYVLVHKLDVTRDDIEKYFDAAGFENVPERIYEGLLTDDVEEAKKLLKSEYAFYLNGNLYTIFDVNKLIQSGGYPTDLESPEHDEVWLNIEEYYNSTGRSLGGELKKLVSERADAARARENTN